MDIQPIAAGDNCFGVILESAFDALKIIDGPEIVVIEKSDDIALGGSLERTILCRAGAEVFGLLEELDRK